MISTCGLNCDTCRIYLATLEKDETKRQSMRIEIARICREQYGMNLMADDITDCDGCRAPDNRLFSGCRSCEIRACSKSRILESCAACHDFPCRKLDRVFQEDPKAKERLESVRQHKT
jgi:hypothetical protein